MLLNANDYFRSFSDVEYIEKMATIFWASRKLDIYQFSKVENVVYDCIEEKYFINLWYSSNHNYLTFLTLIEMDAII